MSDPRRMLRRAGALVAVRELLVTRAEVEVAEHASRQCRHEGVKAEVLEKLQEIEGAAAHVWIKSLQRLERETAQMVARTLELDRALFAARRGAEMAKRLREDAMQKVRAADERRALEEAGEAAVRTRQVSRKARWDN